MLFNFKKLYIYIYILVWGGGIFGGNGALPPATGSCAP